MRLTRRIADLLRVIRKGPAVKNTVDEAIDQCAEVFNLRDSIEEARTKAEQASDEKSKKMYAQRGMISLLYSLLFVSSQRRNLGLQNLRRYFDLIVFQAYLQSTEPDTMSTVGSFESFVKSLPGSFSCTILRKHP